MIDINKHEVDHNCPTCGSKIKFKLSQLAAEEIVHCRSCGEYIQLIDEGGKSKRQMSEMNKQFKSLEKTLKNLGKQ